LGVYLTDLTFLDDGQADVREESNLINFSKRIKMGHIIKELLDFQQHSYNLRPVPEIQVIF